MENGRVFHYKGKTLVQLAQGECTCEDCVVSKYEDLQGLCQKCGSTVRKDGKDVMYLDFLVFVEKAINVLEALTSLYPQKTLENVLVQLKAVKSECDKNKIHKDTVVGPSECKGGFKVVNGVDNSFPRDFEPPF